MSVSFRDFDPRGLMWWLLGSVLLILNKSSDYFWITGQLNKNQKVSCKSSRRVLNNIQEVGKSLNSYSDKDRWLYFRSQRALFCNRIINLDCNGYFKTSLLNGVLRSNYELQRLCEYDPLPFFLHSSCPDQRVPCPLPPLLVLLRSGPSHCVW